MRFALSWPTTVVLVAGLAALVALAIWGPADSRATIAEVIGGVGMLALAAMRPMLARSEEERAETIVPPPPEDEEDTARLRRREK